MKKILSALRVVILLITFLCIIYNVYGCYQLVDALIFYSLPDDIVSTYYESLIMKLFTVFSLTFFFIWFMPFKTIPKYAKYTYEEYKEYRDNKKKLSKSLKMQKLKQQIKELEKTE